MCEVGLSREEFFNMTLGEFWEHEYYHEYMLSQQLNNTRRIIHSLFVSMGGAKKLQIEDIMKLPLIDKEPVIIPLKPIEERKTLVDSIQNFNL